MWTCYLNRDENNRDMIMYTSRSIEPYNNWTECWECSQNGK